MARTAISALQEYLQKNSLPLPNYTLVNRHGPQHETTFTIRVTVSPYFTDGTAKTKQAAKHSAAREMIELLNRQPNHNINYAESSIDVFSTPSILPPENVILPRSQSPKKDDLSATSPSINSVGIVQEICVKRKMKSPIYEECDPELTGSFTYRCVLGQHFEKATASSKKRAKQKSAELMRQYLIEKKLAFDDAVDNKQRQEDDDLDILVIDTEKLRFDDDHSHKQMTEKAIMLFPNLKKNVGVTVEERNDLSIANFHSQFRNSIDSANVKKFLSFYKSLNFETVKSSITHSEHILKNMENILNIKTERKDLKTNEGNKYLVVIEFLSKPAPLFRTVGKGSSYNEAYLTAINRTINGVHLLLI